MRKSIFLLMLVTSLLLTACQGGMTLFSTATPTLTTTVTPTLTATVTPTSTPTLTATVTPTPYSERGPFTLAYPLDGLLKGEWLDLQIVQDTLWVVSSKGAAWRNLNEAAFNTVTFTAKYIGIDQSNRLWVHHPLTGSISSWDGAEWKDYAEEDGWLIGTQLSNSPLKNTLAADKQGSVWLSTPWGAARFDGQSWARYPFYKMGFKSPANGYVRSLVFAASQDGSFWAASCIWKDGLPTSEGGLSHFDGTAWSRVSLPELNTCISAMASASQDLWLAAPSKLIHFDPVSLHSLSSVSWPTLADQATIAYTDSIQITNNGGLWPVFFLCTPNGCGQLAVRYKMTLPAAQFGEISGFPIRSVIFDQNEMAWILSDGRIGKSVQNSNGTIDLVTLSDLNAISGAMDKNGGLWVLGRFGESWGLWNTDTKSLTQ